MMGEKNSVTRPPSGFVTCMLLNERVVGCIVLMCALLAGGINASGVDVLINPGALLGLNPLQADPLVHDYYSCLYS